MIFGTQASCKRPIYSLQQTALQTLFHRGEAYRPGYNPKSRGHVIWSRTISPWRNTVNRIHISKSKPNKSKSKQKLIETRVQERAYPQLLQPQAASDKGFRDNGQFKIKTWRVLQCSLKNPKSSFKNPRCSNISLQFQHSVDRGRKIPNSSQPWPHSKTLPQKPKSWALWPTPLTPTLRRGRKEIGYSKSFLAVGWFSGQPGPVALYQKHMLGELCSSLVYTVSSSPGKVLCVWHVQRTQSS